jgi:hypothetical protein
MIKTGETMADLENLETWAILQGYDPDHEYMLQGTGDLAPGMLSPHFSRAEFACNCCQRLPEDKEPPAELLEVLEALRARWGKPVNVNSGYRCPAHNAAVGGASASRHMKGDAADVWIEGVDPSLVYDWADSKIGDRGGVGRYNTFTHLDVRGYRARW